MSSETRHPGCVYLQLHSEVQVQAWSMWVVGYAQFSFEKVLQATDTGKITLTKKKEVSQC